MWKWETDKQPKGVIVVVHDMLEHHNYYTELIFQFRRRGYHVVTGDLPGHGQTTRLNKGHINSFDQYTSRISDWNKVALEYNLPTYFFGQGLGGLIVLEAVRLKMIQPDGVILINPMLALRQSFINRKNTIRTSIRATSDESRFDPGIKLSYFTDDPFYLEKYEQDELMIEKVSYQWYRIVTNQMKKTSDSIENTLGVPMLGLFSTENEIIEPFLSSKSLKNVRSKYIEVHMLEQRNHSILQHENVEFPMYLIDKFLTTRLYDIGLMI